MPATPASTTCAELSAAAPLPIPLTPGVYWVDEEEEVPDAVALAECELVPVAITLVELPAFVAVIVTVLLARVIVLVIVEVAVTVVVPEVESCARARSGSIATGSTFVKCMIVNLGSRRSRVYPNWSMESETSYSSKALTGS